MIKEALSAAVAAFNQVVNEPQMIKCDRCDGKGYHHGFGEDGASPDWCIKCGGNQFDVMPGEEERAMQAAVSTYLSSIGGVVVPREPTPAMISAYCELQNSLGVEAFANGRLAWEAMISASPLNAPIEAGNGGDGWNRDMDAAPKDKSPVIIAVLHKDNEAYIIGEAYFDPEHYGNGDWWWAGNSYEDYHGGPISEINYHGPSAWRHLPSPPSPSNEGEKP